MGTNMSKIIWNTNESEIMRKYLGDLVDSEEFKHLFVADANSTHLHKCIKMIHKYPLLNDYLEEYLKSCDSKIINKINNHRETPLYLATINDCSKRTVKNLIKAGANIDLDVYDSIPALHNCIRNGAEKVFKILIKAGANVNLEDSDGCTALHYAVQSKSITMVEILIKSKVDLNVQDLEKKTALHYALESCYPEKIEKEISLTLIKAGINVNLQDIDGNTALHYTSSKKITKVLIDAKANPNLCNKHYGNTPLHHALDIGATEIAEILITANTDIHNITNKKGKTSYDMMKEKGIK